MSNTPCACPTLSAAGVAKDLQRYLGDMPGVVRVQPAGAGYAVTLDLTPYLTTKAGTTRAFSLQMAPLHYTVTAMGQGKWHVVQDQPWNVVLNTTFAVPKPAVQAGQKPATGATWGVPAPARHIVPVTLGNCVLAVPEADAYCADFGEEKSFRGDNARALVRMVAVMARIQAETEEFRQRQSSTHLWRPHADALLLLEDAATQAIHSASAVLAIAALAGAGAALKAGSFPSLDQPPTTTPAGASIGTKRALLVPTGSPGWPNHTSALVELRIEAMVPERSTVTSRLFPASAKISKLPEARASCQG